MSHGSAETRYSSQHPKDRRYVLIMDFNERRRFSGLFLPDEIGETVTFLPFPGYGVPYTEKLQIVGAGKASWELHLLLRNSQLQEGFVQENDVVLGSVEHAVVPRGTRLCGDQLFTAVNLLDELSQQNLTGSETSFSIGVRNGQFLPVLRNNNVVVAVLSYCHNENLLQSV
ncbi:hypothetical protein Trydic_g19622 [Trypoxylus dichotomus]